LEEIIMASKRTIITLSESDKSWLESYSKTYGLSMAEAIRRGISRLKKEEYKSTYKEIVRKTVGLWEKGDGLQYQDELRSEWIQG
jgi:hypothetical protein